MTRSNIVSIPSGHVFVARLLPALVPYLRGPLVHIIPPSWQTPQRSGCMVKVNDYGCYDLLTALLILATRCIANLLEMPSSSYRVLRLDYRFGATLRAL